MINHQEQNNFLKEHKNIFNSSSPLPAHEKHRLIEILLHGCDISNSTKKFEIYMKFAVAVNLEFFAQGDKEKSLGLPVSFGCDRETVNFYDGQIGFIENIIEPFFGNFTDIFTDLKFLLDPIRQNDLMTKKQKEEDTNVEIISHKSTKATTS